MISSFEIVERLLSLEISVKNVNLYTHGKHLLEIIVNMLICHLEKEETLKE